MTPTEQPQAGRVREACSFGGSAAVWEPCWHDEAYAGLRDVLDAKPSQVPHRHPHSGCVVSGQMGGVLWLSDSQGAPPPAPLLALGESRLRGAEK